MFTHNKRLMHTVRVSEPNPKLASLIMEQFGGADGELAAAMRYFTQGLADLDAGRRDLLLDIATEELSHLEVVGNIVCMLNAGVKGQMAEGTEAGRAAGDDHPGRRQPHQLAAVRRRRRPGQFRRRALDRGLCRLPDRADG